MGRRLADGTALLRRDSGGGAVLTGPWLVSASVVVPVRHAWVRDGVVASYRAIGELHAVVLAELGIVAEVLRPEQLAHANAIGPTVDWACFGGLSPWEVVAAGGRKLVGLAQCRRREVVLLVSGTLVAPPDWALLCEAAGRPQDEAVLHARTVSCDVVAGVPVAARVFAAGLQRQLQLALSCEPQR